MAKTLSKFKPALIVLESTGGYERPVVAELAAKQLPYVVVNPAKARNFARALGLTAKTDKIDAQVLARFGRELKLEPKAMADESVRELKELAERRRQLVKMRVMEQNRLQQAVSPQAKASINILLKHLDEQISSLDDSMDKHIGSDPDLSHKEQLLMSIPGVGAQTARVLLCYMPELGSLSKGQTASLAGLAPHNRDSGLWRGRRMIIGGRSTVNAMLKNNQAFILENN